MFSKIAYMNIKNGNKLLELTSMYMITHFLLFGWAWA